MLRITSTILCLNSSHIYITDKTVMSELVGKGWEFLDAAYKWVGGFQSFEDEADMVNDSLMWLLTYDGKKPKDQKDIDWNHVYCVTVCKSKHGLKTVAFGQQSTIDGKAALATESQANEVDFRQRRAAAKRKALEWQAKHCWQEVSGAPERLFLGMGTPKIPYEELAATDVFKGKEVHPLADGYHYERKINGVWHTKIAVGNFHR